MCCCCIHALRWTVNWWRILDNLLAESQPLKQGLWRGTHSKWLTWLDLIVQIIMRRLYLKLVTPPFDFSRHRCCSAIGATLKNMGKWIPSMQHELILQPQKIKPCANQIIWIIGHNCKRFVHDTGMKIMKCMEGTFITICLVSRQEWT